MKPQSKYILQKQSQQELLLSFAFIPQVDQCIMKIHANAKIFSNSDTKSIQIPQQSR
jgi:hypothetical protein